MVSHQRGLAALYTATVILAINGVLSKAIPLDAVTITCLRCAIAFTALACILSLQKSDNLFRLQNTKSLPIVFVIGMLMAAHWSSFFHAMQISTVAIGILAHYSFPVITVIVEPLLDKRRPKASDLIAGTIVLGGVALMVPSWELGQSAFTGVIFGLLSACTWAARNIIQRRYVATESGQSIMAYQLLVVVLVTFAFMDTSAISDLNRNSWLLIILLGVVSTAFGHTLISISLRALDAKSVGLISCMQPPMAIALSWLLLEENPGLRTLLGGGLILAVALYESAKKQSEAKKALRDNNHPA